MSLDQPPRRPVRLGAWLAPPVAAAALLGCPTHATDPLAQGQHIVASRCAACHGAAGGPPTRPGEAPNLAWVAREHPSWLEGVFLRPPGPMLGVVIAPEERDALRAWFALEGARQSRPSSRGSSDGLTADASAPGSAP